MKRKVITPEFEHLIDKNVKIRISGISDSLIHTLGVINLIFGDVNASFHLVSNEFNIPHDGILGSEYLHAAQGKIDYENNNLVIGNHKIPFIKKLQYNTIQSNKTKSTANPRNSKTSTGNGPDQSTTPDDIKFQKEEAVTRKRSSRSPILVGNLQELRDVVYQKKNIKEIRNNTTNGLTSGSCQETNTERINEYNINEYNMNHIEEIFTIAIKNIHIIKNFTNECYAEIRDADESRKILQNAVTDLLSRQDIKLVNSQKLNDLNKIFEKKLGTTFLTPIIEEENDLDYIDTFDRINLEAQDEFEDISYIEWKKILNEIKYGEDYELHTFTLLELGNHKELNKSQHKPRFNRIMERLQLNHLKSETEKQLIHRVIEENQDRFYLEEDALPTTNLAKYHIRTISDKPINIKQYRLPHGMQDEIDSQIKDMLDKGIIKPSRSSFNNPIWLVPKKADSEGIVKMRLVIDFRKLNESSIFEPWPMKNPIEIFDQLKGAKHFSVIDIKSGFWHIPLAEEDQEKTAFTTPSGRFEFTRVPFGLLNGSSEFQRIADYTIRGLKNVFFYIDDLICFTETLEEHEQLLKKVMSRLRKANLTINVDKCEFLKDKVKYLGHIVSKEGVMVDPAKTESVKEFPQPRNVKSVRQFLGLTGFYRRHIDKYAQIAKPLTELLRKDITFLWTEEANKAFELLKEKLTTAPVLTYPDFEKEFIIHSDSSGYAIGGALPQLYGKYEKPIAYTSRNLTPTEKNLFHI